MFYQINDGWTINLERIVTVMESTDERHQYMEVSFGSPGDTVTLQIPKEVYDRSAKDERLVNAMAFIRNWVRERTIQ